jgi:ankyrin repeat protein
VKGQTPLHVAAKRPGKIMVELLLRRGASPMAEDHHQEIPLMAAVRALNVEGADQLLTDTSDVSMTNVKKQTALHLACQVASLPIVQGLIQAGVMLDAQDIHGNTALHYATVNNSLEIVQCLLTRRADPTIRNAQSKSPFFYASPGAAKVFHQYFDSARGMNRFSTSPESRKSNSSSPSMTRSPVKQRSSFATPIPTPKKKKVSDLGEVEQFQSEVRAELSSINQRIDQLMVMMEDLKAHVVKSDGDAHKH